MTNAMCAGEQDRNNNTSETRPYIPPPKTKNCYRTHDKKNGMIPSTFGAFFRRAARRPQQKDQSQLQTVYHTPGFPISPLTTHTLRGGLGAAP